MLAALDELIILQSLIDNRDQLLGCSLHLDVMWPDAPPERKLAIDALRGSIGENRRAGTIFGDEMGRCTGASEDNYGLNAGFFAERSRGVADSMGLGEALALRLARRTIAGLCLQGDTHHHLHGLDRIGASSGFAAQHNGIGAV